MLNDLIIVLDYGSQYSQLICRRIREMHVYSLLLPYSTTAKEIKNYGNVKGIVLSGGPASVYENNALGIDKEIYGLNIPILGICYGMQLTSKIFGGEIIHSEKREYGGQEIEVNVDSILFNNTPSKQVVWMSHGDKVNTLPKDFTCIASSISTPITAIENTKKSIFCVQFHPEVNNSQYGKKILENFVFNICKASGDWTMDKFVEEKINEIKSTVQDKKVLLAISGGVDSSVTAILLSKAIGNNLTCLFIDHGLLRKDEAKKVMDRFKNKLKINVKLIDASERFLSKLKGISDPETKRKIIGKEFIDVFNEESKKIGKFDFLAQGTLYTDVIESGNKVAKTIKSHHNVGGLPKDMPFKLIEPLNKLFKDEVRLLGKALKMDDELINRQPFPGPGLSIRIVGEITKEKLEIVRESDNILQEEIKKANLNDKIWQYFAVLLNTKSVGVMGDNRTYFSTIAIRAVTSLDGMTADWAKIPYDVLDNISRRIVNEVNGVNRVVYDITSKPPSTIEFE